MSGKISSEFQKLAASITTTVNKLQIKVNNSLEQMSANAKQGEPTEAEVTSGAFNFPLIEQPLLQGRARKPKSRSSLLEITAIPEDQDAPAVNKSFSDALKKAKIDTVVEEIVPKDKKIPVVTKNTDEVPKQNCGGT